MYGTKTGTSLKQKRAVGTMHVLLFLKHDPGHRLLSLPVVFCPHGTGADLHCRDGTGLEVEETIYWKDEKGGA